MVIADKILCKTEIFIDKLNIKLNFNRKCIMGKKSKTPYTCIHTELWKFLTFNIYLTFTIFQAQFLNMDLEEWEYDPEFREIFRHVSKNDKQYFLFLSSGVKIVFFLSQSLTTNEFWKSQLSVFSSISSVIGSKIG